jgi:hypothetical protein
MGCYSSFLHFQETLLKDTSLGWRFIVALARFKIDGRSRCRGRGSRSKEGWRREGRAKECINTAGNKVVSETDVVLLPFMSLLLLRQYTVK